MKSYLLLGANAALAVAANSTSSSLLSSETGELFVQSVRFSTNNSTVDLGIYADAYQKAKAFASKLTTAQKVSLITGGDINGSDFTWSALENKDGFAGINSQYYVSGFPMGNALSMTWSRQHAEDEAKASGREFYLMGYNLING